MPSGRTKRAMRRERTKNTTSANSEMLQVPVPSPRDGALLCSGHRGLSAVHQGQRRRRVTSPAAARAATRAIRARTTSGTESAFLVTRMTVIRTPATITARAHVVTTGLQSLDRAGGLWASEVDLLVVAGILKSSGLGPCSHPRPRLSASTRRPGRPGVASAGSSAVRSPTTPSCSP